MYTSDITAVASCKAVREHYKRKWHTGGRHHPHLQARARRVCALTRPGRRQHRAPLGSPDKDVFSPTTSAAWRFAQPCAGPTISYINHSVALCCTAAHVAHSTCRQRSDSQVTTRHLPADPRHAGTGGQVQQDGLRAGQQHPQDTGHESTLLLCLFKSALAQHVYCVCM